MYVNRLLDGLTNGSGHVWLVLTREDVAALALAIDNEDDDFVLRKDQHEGDRDIHVRVALNVQGTIQSEPACPCVYCTQGLASFCVQGLVEPLCARCGGGGYEDLPFDADGLCPPIPPYCGDCGGTGDAVDGGW